MAGWLAGWLGVVLMGWGTTSAPTASVRLWAGAAVLPFVGAQMDPVAVLEALEAVGYTPDALEAVGQRIIGAEVVGVDDLVAAGLSGGDVVAVRRALDPSVSEQTHGCGCVLGEAASEVHGGVRAERSGQRCDVDVCRGIVGVHRGEGMDSAPLRQRRRSGLWMRKRRGSDWPPRLQRLSASVRRLSRRCVCATDACWEVVM